VVDTRSDRVANVRGIEAGRLYLREAGGGKEWEAMPAQVRPATEREVLSAEVAEINHHSRFGASLMNRVVRERAVRVRAGDLEFVNAAWRKIRDARRVLVLTVCRRFRRMIESSGVCAFGLNQVGEWWSCAGICPIGPVIEHRGVPVKTFPGWTPFGRDGGSLQRGLAMRAHDSAKHCSADEKAGVRTAPFPRSGTRPDLTSLAGILAPQRSAGNPAVSRVPEETRHQRSARCGMRPPTGRSADVALRRPRRAALSGVPLDEPVREEMEARLGAGFADVRLHTDSAPVPAPPKSAPAPAPAATMSSSAPLAATSAPSLTNLGVAEDPGQIVG
jgi:Domain of unknown function (DUF4157)